MHPYAYAFLGGLCAKTYDDLVDNQILAPTHPRTPVILEGLKGAQWMLLALSSVSDFNYAVLLYAAVAANCWSEPAAFGNAYERALLFVFPLLFFLNYGTSAAVRVKDVLFLLFVIGIMVIEPRVVNEEYSLNKMLTRLGTTCAVILFILLAKRFGVGPSVVKLVHYALGYGGCSVVFQGYLVRQALLKGEPPFKLKDGVKPTACVIPVPENTADKPIMPYNDALAHITTCGDVIQDVAERLLIRTNGYSKSILDLLALYGHLPIKQLWLSRCPLPPYVDFGLNMLTLGRWNSAKAAHGPENKGHLALILELEGGQKILMEKNAAIQIKRLSQPSKKAELLALTLPVTPMTLKTLLAQGRQTAGTNEKWFEYDAYQNNCCHFLQYVLQGSQLAAPQMEAFMWQNTAKILLEQPVYLEWVAKGVTDIGTIGTRLLFT